MFKLMVTMFGVLGMVSASVYALVVDANKRGSSLIRVSLEKVSVERSSRLMDSEEEALLEALMGDSNAGSPLNRITEGKGWSRVSERTVVEGGTVVEKVDTTSTEEPLAVLRPPKPKTGGDLASEDGDGASDEELRKIEMMMMKQKREAYKRLFTVARRARLNSEQREILRSVADDLWRQIEGYYEEFKYSQRTDYDRQLLRQSVRTAFRSAMQDLQYQLGDDAFKRFMRENRYYRNPEERMVDIQRKMNEMDRQMDKQQKQLKGMERTFKRRPRWYRPPSRGSGRKRSSSGRRR